jgi:hypothetical protein
LDEPARLVVNLTLNTGGVLDPALRAIRQTVDVVTFCLNVIEQGDLSSGPQTDMMSFELQFSDEMSAERRKAAYAHWRLSKRCQDLARRIRQTLEEAYFYNGMVARAGGLRTWPSFKPSSRSCGRPPATCSSPGCWMRPVRH